MERMAYFWSDYFPRKLVLGINKDFAAQQLREPLRELVYLILAVRSAGDADQGHQSTASFFLNKANWGSTASRDWFDVRDHPFVEKNEKELRLKVDTGHFRIGYGRILYLVAVYHFFVEMTDNAAFADELEACYVEGCNGHSFKERSIKNLINRASKDLYDFTMKKVPGIKVRQKYLQLLGWLKEADTEEIRLASITDKKLLEFWQENARAEEKVGDFVTYEKVVQAFVSLFHCLQVTETELRAANASTIGYDVAGGEVHQDSLVDTVGAEYETEAGEILERLLENPADEIKFLNTREVALFSPFASAGEAIFQLPISFLRRMAIKPQQDKIIKGNSASRSAADMKTLYKGEGIENYAHQLSRLNELLDHFGKVALASCHALAISRGVSEEEIAQNLKDADFPLDDISAALDIVGSTSGDMSLDDWPKAMSKAWNEINRKGFVEPVKHQDERDLGFAIGAPAVLALRAHLEQYKKLLLPKVEKDGGLSEIFAADLSIITSVLLLYGETS